jgi:hypothetical protein
MLNSPAGLNVQAPLALVLAVGKRLEATAATLFRIVKPAPAAVGTVRLAAVVVAGVTALPLPVVDAKGERLVIAKLTAESGLSGRISFLKLRKW